MSRIAVSGSAVSGGHRSRQHLVELLSADAPGQLAERGDGGHDQVPEASGV
jgi:hypothetical protein